MTTNLWLQKAIEKLESASVPSPKLDAEILLADALEKDRSYLIAHPEIVLRNEILQKLNMQIKRRMKHEPIAYIRGKQEFYGREFIVSPDTLTPRPETETMIELLFQRIGDWRLEIGDKLQIVDIGTGSGCIVITAALELAKTSNLKSSVSFVGLDVSVPALKIAKKNANKLKADISFKKFDLLNDKLSSVFNPQSSICILANLPYVPNDFHINLAASHEPAQAIFGGYDGLDLYRKLFEQLSTPTTEAKHITVFTESLPQQHGKLPKIAKYAGFELVKSQDFIQVFKRN